MLSKNLNKPRRKPGVTTVALLSLLLGAQVAALADLQFDYNFGFNKGQTAIKIFGISNYNAIVGYYSGACNTEFPISTSDYLACMNGGLNAYDQAAGKGYYG